MTETQIPITIHDLYVKVLKQQLTNATDDADRELLSWLTAGDDRNQQADRLTAMFAALVTLTLVDKGLLHQIAAGCVQLVAALRKERDAIH